MVKHTEDLPFHSFLSIQFRDNKYIHNVVKPSLIILKKIIVITFIELLPYILISFIFQNPNELISSTQGHVTGKWWNLVAAHIFLTSSKPYFFF